MDISSLLPLLLVNSYSDSNSSSSTNANNDEFLSLMTLLMSNISSSDNSENIFGGDTFQMMGMTSLYEQLLADRVEMDDSSTTSGRWGKKSPDGDPVAGGYITQEFHPGHNGIDYGVVVGTDVRSTMDGEVVSAGWSTVGYGNLVVVRNGDYETYYAHLSEIPVSVGDHVHGGQVIGLSGNTGNSTGPHLHYEIRKDGVAINPVPTTMA